MNTLEIAWLAGLLEGEGCFHVNFSQKNPYIFVEMQMTDEDVVYKAQEVSGIGNVTHISRKTAGWNDCWRWSISTQKDAAALMMTIYPLMGQRRQEKIKECLAAWRSFPYREYRD